MIGVITILVLSAAAVFGAPQLSDIELKEQAFNRINEAEYDYKWDKAQDSVFSKFNRFQKICRFALSDGHEQQQLRKEVDGEGTVVIGFYKYVGKKNEQLGLR